MNLSKSFEFFNPSICKDRIHIIGCGSVGSTVAELLARFGLINVSLYDFDVVEEHNLANQMFTTKNLYKPKVEGVYDRWVDINPEAAKTIKLYGEGWTGQKLSGYVFLCVDNIELRKKIVEENKYNPNIKAMFDFRTALDTSQHYAADWSKQESIKALLETMDFTHEEAEKNVPVSACKVALCVMPTVWSVSMAGVVNFVNFLKEGRLEQSMILRPFDFETIVI
jgi:hypothetical protein